MTRGRSIRPIRVGGLEWRVTRARAAVRWTGAGDLRSPAAGLRSPAAGLRSLAAGLRSPAAGSPAVGLHSPAVGLHSPAAGLHSPAAGSLCSAPRGGADPTTRQPFARAATPPARRASSRERRSPAVGFLSSPPISPPRRHHGRNHQSLRIEVVYVRELSHARMLRARVSRYRPRAPAGPQPAYLAASDRIPSGIESRTHPH